MGGASTRWVELQLRDDGRIRCWIKGRIPAREPRGLKRHRPRELPGGERWQDATLLGTDATDRCAGLTLKPELARNGSAASQRRFSRVALEPSFSDGAIQSVATAEW